MLDFKILNLEAGTWLLFLGVLFIAYLIAKQSYKPTIYDSFERVGNAALTPKFLGKSANTLFADGFHKVMKPYDKPFVVKWWAIDNLILPPKYLPDLRSMKLENASFLKNFSDAVNLQHSVGTLYEADRMGEILRRGMNPILSSLTSIIVHELDLAIEKEIGEAKDWKHFKATELFIAISHRVVSRLLAGEELCRDENFIHTSAKFADSTFITGVIIAQLPLGPFRPAVGWLIAQYHCRLLAGVMKQTEPVVAKRMEEAREKENPPRYDDSIEWAIRLNDPPTRDSKVVALEMLHILEAAGGAPGALMTEAIYQVLMEPEYRAPLLDELVEARNKHGMTDAAIQNLPKLDSFLMETNRLWPVGGVTAARTIMQQPAVLHDGLTLPVGTRIGFLCKTMQRDDRLWPDALRFDGWRWLKANESRVADESGEGVKSGPRYTASMTNTDHLPWGYGAHACPGRFYAIRLVKLMFMALLPRYDIEWSDEKDKSRTERPKTLELEGQFLPNMEQKIKLRAKSSTKV